MTVKITIIGLGKIGTSVGLALAKHANQLYRVGHDIYPEHARRARKMGALDKVAYNLPSSVSDADLVLLALPIDQIKETLEIIAPDLKESAVVMDTSPVKAAAAAWAQEFLTSGRYYVGLTPVLNPLHLHEMSTGADAAHEDLFEKGLIGITAPSGTASGAMKLAADLTNLLGAKPLFMDMVEVDSLMATVHLLPQLLAAGLVSATVAQPGWTEGRKLAGAAYAQAGNPVISMDTPEALGNAALLSEMHVTRMLDAAIASLQTFRDAIANQDESALIEGLKTARKGCEQWWEQRANDNWEQQLPGVEMPDSGGGIRQWILGRRRQG